MAAAAKLKGEEVSKAEELLETACSLLDSVVQTVRGSESSE